MGITYFKRFRMEMELRLLAPEPPPLPADYALLAWSERMIPLHSDVKYRCFCDEMDASVFPCLGSRSGCKRLMQEIADREGFLPGATWLLQHWPENDRRPEMCGTIQGVAENGAVGAIQNVGITPAHRGRGLGAILVWHSLQGFKQAKLERVFLEVTAHNTPAIRLYQRIGFRKTKTVYKASEVAYV